MICVCAQDMVHANMNKMWNIIIKTSQFHFLLFYTTITLFFSLVSVSNAEVTKNMSCAVSTAGLFLFLLKISYFPSSLYFLLLYKTQNLQSNIHLIYGKTLYK